MNPFLWAVELYSDHPRVRTRRQSFQQHSSKREVRQMIGAEL